MEPVAFNRGFEPLPPHHSEAEASVLGACLIDSEAFGVVAEQLTAASFYHPRNRDLWTALDRLAQRGVVLDFVTVSDELERLDLMDAIGGVGYLSELLTTVPTSIHAAYYATIVARLATLRRLIQAGTQIATLGYEDTDDLEETLAAADQTLKAVTGTLRTQSWSPIGEAATAFLESVTPADADGRREGVVPTGFLDLDRLLGGFYAGDLVILAARPGFGKTALGLGFAHEIGVRLKANVGVFSLEMSRLQVAGRLLAAMADLDVQRLREGRIGAMEYDRIQEAQTKLDAATLWVDDSSTLSLRELETRARRLHGEHALALLLVDYLQLVSAPGQNRVQSIGAISRALKALAGDLGCPVLALSQLSRAVESRPDHRPLLSDLRESGDLEQDADVVMFISREDQYDRETERKGVAEIIVAKQRNGPTGICSLLFLDRTARFVDVGMR